MPKGFQSENKKNAFSVMHAAVMRKVLVKLPNVLQCTVSSVSRTYCSRSHARMKAVAGHVQVEIGKQTKKEEIALKLPATCDIHRDEEIKVFCLECNYVSRQSV